MSRKILFAVILILAGALFAQPVLAQPSDIGGHWAEKQIGEWTDKGLIKGYPNGTFKPDSTITRAEFITMVNRSFGLSQSADADFSDVRATDWFAGEIAKARAAGYISGYADGTIKPDNSISRQEAAAILAKISKLNTSGSLDVADSFKDSVAIPQWSRGSVAAVVAKGYMKGYPDQTYQPERFITRAEAIAALDKAVKEGAADRNVYDKAGTYGPATGTETIEGNVTVSVRDVKLQNLVIKGDLLLAEGIGDGDVTLNNVTVTGNTIIKGGGAHSVVLEDCNLPSITVSREGVRVVASGNTSVRVVTLESGAVLVQATVSGPGIETVTVSQEIPANAAVSLTGNFQTVNVEAANISVGVTEGTVASLNVSENAQGAVLNLAGGATVNTLTLNAAVTVSGTGSIQTANVNASGSSIEQRPNNVVSPSGVTVTTGTTTTTTNRGGGGGGGGDSNSSTAVTLTVPELGRMPWHFDAHVTNTATTAAITDLVVGNFALKKDGAVIPLAMANHDERDDEPGRYTIYPEDAFRPMSGEYTLTFSKTGYTSTSVTFEIAPIVTLDIASVTPSTHAAGSEQVIAVEVSTQNVADGEEVTVSFNDYQGNALSPAISNTGTITGNEATVNLSVSDAVYANSYQIIARVGENMDYEYYTITGGIVHAEAVITEGSIVFTYQFFDGAFPNISYGDAHLAPYYLDKNASTVTLRNDTEEVTKTLSELAIPPDGVLEYVDIANVISALWANPTDFFIPTEIELMLQPIAGQSVLWEAKTISRNLAESEISLMTAAP